MLYEKFGRGIAERFLVPYNEKLYACDLEVLDREAMGRFFPHADLEDIVRNMRRPDNSSYNASFTYPKGGAIEYVRALTRDIPDEKILLNAGVAGIDLTNKVATLTDGREIAFEYLVSSAPFDHLTRMCALEHDADTFTYNKVLCFNLGFDRKGKEGVHWIYYPSRDVSFYRIGFYDNIMGTDRMSLYVELGFAPDATYDVDAARARVLADLERVGVIEGHELVSHHSVTLDPAYVHITTRSRAEHARLTDILGLRGVHSIGRYGGWTYCSIEDNIVEARPDLQTHLIRLARHKVAGAGGLTLVLTASATQSALLQDGLLELVDLRIDLDAWDELDTTGYLQHAMVEAGSEQPMFTDSAINELHRLSQGIPRHVNRLAEHALLLGSQNPGQMIDPETVRAAHQSLSLPGSS